VLLGRKFQKILTSPLSFRPNVLFDPNYDLIGTRLSRLCWLAWNADNCPQSNFAQYLLCEVGIRKIALKCRICEVDPLDRVQDSDSRSKLRRGKQRRFPFHGWVHVSAVLNQEQGHFFIATIRRLNQGRRARFPRRVGIGAIFQEYFRDFESPVFGCNRQGSSSVAVHSVDVGTSGEQQPNLSQVSFFGCQM